MFDLELIINGEIIFLKEFNFLNLKPGSTYVQRVDLLKVIEAYERVNNIKALDFQLRITNKET